MTPALVADLNVTPRSGSPEFWNFGTTTNGIVFRASSDDFGFEPWVTDGTPSGTKLLADTNPGPDSSSVEGMSALYKGGRFFLTRPEYTEYPTEPVTMLWKTDGTTTGTSLVKALEGTGGTAPGFASFDGKVYFVSGEKLWETDGTEQGTSVVSVPVPAGGQLSRPFVLGNKLFVIGSGLFSQGTQAIVFSKPAAGAMQAVATLDGVVVDGWNGDKMVVLGSTTLFVGYSRSVQRDVLCATDGTTAGTRIVNTASDDGYGGFSVFNGRAFFSRSDSTNGNELWVSDGTPTGTKLLKDLTPGVDSSNPSGFTAVGGKLFFATYPTSNWESLGGGELWKTDGTALGTTLVKKFTPDTTGGVPGVSGLAALGDKVYFSAGGYKLWRSDGTTAGTTVVKDINPSEPLTGSGGFGAMAEFNGRLYFDADDGVNGRELWSTDGTTAGTKLAVDIQPGNEDGVSAGSAVYVAGIALGGAFLFAGDDGTKGTELYKRDAAGRVSLVKDIKAAYEWGYNEGSNPRSFVANGAVAYFVADDRFSELGDIAAARLWRTDGTTAGTQPVPLPPSVGEPVGEMVSFGGSVFFATSDSSGFRSKLVSTTGTESGTVEVIDAAPNTLGEIVAFSGKLFFTTTGPLGTQAYVMETAKSSPVLLESSLGSLLRADSFTPAGSAMFFFGTTSDSDPEQLWVTDGTPAGTKPVTGSSRGWQLTAVGGSVFYIRSSDSEAVELWRTTTVGGSLGTVLVSTIDSGSDYTWVGGMVPQGSKVYFPVSGSDGSRLWESDGTAGGTKKVVFTGSQQPAVELLSPAIGNTIYAAARDATRGLELWTLTVGTQTVPGSPTGVAGAPGDGRVTLTWAPPASNGGAAITDYVIRSSADGGKTWIRFFDAVSAATSATVSGLTNGTSYLFRVSAVNAAGTGSPSANSAAVTPRTVPTAPTAVVGTPGNGLVNLRWAAPASNGGATITDYVIRYSADGGKTWIRFLDAVSAATSATVTGLANGTGYLFKVSAVNVAGSGGPSVNSATVTPRTVPSAPSSLVGTVGNGRVNLTWTAPASNGGAAVTDYAIRYSVDGGKTWIRFFDAVSAATSATVTGLTNGKSYLFKVSALNAAGSSIAAGSSAAFVPRA